MLSTSQPLGGGGGGWDGVGGTSAGFSVTSVSGLKTPRYRVSSPQHLLFSNSLFDEQQHGEIQYSPHQGLFRKYCGVVNKLLAFVIR